MSAIHQVTVGALTIGSGHPLVLIAGPCVIESEAHTLHMAERIAAVCAQLNIPLVFKASFDKANRSSVKSYRGPGLSEGLAILEKVRERIGQPVLSDIHEPHQAGPAGEVLDVIQIPAFLCRQTDLLLAAGHTQKAINVKKGQFLAAEEMVNVVDKIVSTGNRQVLLTERGTFFGYHRLVNDMTAIPKMRRLAPVVFDATHSCQFPGGMGVQTGGQRAYVSTLARAGVAVGADALFLEVHDDPDQALSDPMTVLPLARLRDVLQCCQAVRSAVATQLEQEAPA